MDKATHDRGNVLDLVFGSAVSLIQKAKCALAPHLDTTSDHATIFTSINWSGYIEPVRRLRLWLDTLDPELFSRLLATAIRELDSNHFISSKNALDKYAIDLTNAIRMAYTGAARRSLGHSKGNPWWNDSCKAARLRYKNIFRGTVTVDEAIAEKKKYRGTIKKAKKEFYINKIETASTGKDIFAMTKWHKSTGNFRSIPLKDPRFPDRPPVTTLAEKREILISNLLKNHTAIGDISLDSPTTAVRSIIFPPFSQLEIQESILKTSNATPGADEAPTAILRIAWPLIENYVYAHFHSCLSLGHHPDCFQQAILIMLQKPNKSDPSSLRSYRPIALLSVLGKGLERLIANLNVARQLMTNPTCSSQNIFTKFASNP